MHTGLPAGETCLFFQRLLPTRCLLGWARPVGRKCSCLRLGLTAASYSKQKSWLCSWRRRPLALVLRVHRELQPLEEEVGLKDGRWASILQQLLMRHRCLVGGSCLLTLSMHHSGSAEFCLRLLAPIPPSLAKKWRGFFLVPLAEDMLLSWNFLSHLSKIFKR